MRRGLVTGRERAREEIEAGRVTVAGAPATKPARMVAPDEAIVLLGPPARYVSRGGEKLAAALERFKVDVAGRHVLDAGASTGGFTDCCLQAGAARVVAVDVGYGQLHERLRGDPRVVNHERTNIRHVGADDLGGPFDLVVADLSFISLRTVAESLLSMCAPDGVLVLLVKPQFEVGREVASAGRGVVRDPGDRAAALVAVGAHLRGLGATIMDAMVSPLRGADGNVELLVLVRPPSVGAMDPAAGWDDEQLAELAGGTEP